MIEFVTSACIKSKSTHLLNTKRGFPNIPPFSSEAGIPLEEAGEVLQMLLCDAHPHQQRAATESITVLDLLHQEQAQGSIVTFSSKLDDVLGGGVPVGKTTEICGAPGVGKTQLWYMKLF